MAASSSPPPSTRAIQFQFTAGTLSKQPRETRRSIRILRNHRPKNRRRLDDRRASRSGSPFRPLRSVMHADPRTMAGSCGYLPRVPLRMSSPFESVSRMRATRPEKSTVKGGGIEAPGNPVSGSLCTCTHRSVESLQARFSSKKNFLQDTSHRIFKHMYKILNTIEKITNYTVQL